MLLLYMILVKACLVRDRRKHCGIIGFAMWTSNTVILRVGG